MKKLIIAPHVDDEVIGCGGILDKDTFVYYCGIDESKVAPDPKHRIPQDERVQEIVDCAKYCGYEYEINYESKVNFFEIQYFIGKIEQMINKVKPDCIMLPHPGYNQDHQVIFSASQVALRPHDKNFFVKKVLIYEAIHDFLWTYEKFEPNYFIPIDIEKKIKAYEIHASQVRPFRSSQMLTDLAKMRGAMAHCAYAECFQVQRFVE